jgi:hypothetical protein
MRRRVLKLLAAVAVIVAGVVTAGAAASGLGEDDLVNIISPSGDTPQDAPPVVSPDSAAWD